MTSNRTLQGQLVRSLWQSALRHSNVTGRGNNAPIVDLFFWLAKHVSPEFTFEIGAYEATFSRRAVKAFPGATVVAFEANPYVHARFAERVTALGVEYLNLAVSDQPSGTTELRIPLTQQTGSGQARHLSQVSTVASLMPREGSSSEIVDVPTTTLHHFLEHFETNGLGVAWIDVEGALSRVLAGAGESIERFGLLFVEVESRPLWDGQWTASDTDDYLANRGFALVASDAETPRQANSIYVHESVATDQLLTGIQAAFNRVLNSDQTS